MNGGYLSHDDMVMVATHISDCQVCESTFQDILSNSPDLVEMLLQQSVPLSQLTEDPQYIRLESNARAICQAAITKHYELDPPPDVQTTLHAPAALAGAGMIGPYRIVKRIGHGGMGEVFRVEHPVLGRTYALKTVKLDCESYPDVLTRFRTEAALVARLDHLNIVKIHTYDECDGVPFFTMDLIEGTTLARHNRKQPPSFRAAAEMIRTIAAAVGYAHERHIIHRDLKPSNVLIDRDGQLKVTDFGLAKLTVNTTDKLTHSDAVLGTPSYMSPEQARGDNSSVDERSDVYSLGVMLYEMLAGRLPYDSGEKLDLLTRVASGRFDPPSEHNPDIPTELETICLRCLSLQMQDRFANASELERELDRWLNGTPIESRRPSWIKRLSRRATTTSFVSRATVAILAVALLASAVAMTARDRLRPSLTEIRGPDGKLVPFRAIYGAKNASVIFNTDGTITFGCINDVCLFEYTGGSRDKPFRFSASLQHRSTERDGRVGLFFAHQTHPSPNGPVHQFGRLTYNDLETPADRVGDMIPVEWRKSNEKADVKSTPPPLFKVRTKNVAELELLTYRPVAPERHQSLWHHKTASEEFAICGRAANCARTIQVEVTPQGVSGHWESLAVGSMTSEEIDTDYRDDLTRNPQIIRASELPHTLYAPRGAVGILVERGSVTVRDVTLTPVEK